MTNEKITQAANEMYEVAKRHGLTLGEYEAALLELQWKTCESTKDTHDQRNALPLK